MNPRVEKLKQEREKNEKKIATLQARNKKINSTILELENTDIIGMVREIGMSPDALSELLRSMEKSPIPQPAIIMKEEEPIEK